MFARLFIRKIRRAQVKDRQPPKRQLNSLASSITSRASRGGALPLQTKFGSATAGIVRMSVPAISNSPTTENGHCPSGGPVTPEAARRIVLENIDVVSGTETVPLHSAVGRIAAEELLSAVALA